MAQPPARIGDMLVAAGFVTEAEVQQALSHQKHSGRKLGQELVALGFVSEVQLTQTLSNQLSVPWVSLYRVPFSRELLNLLPAQLAERYSVIPVYVRFVRNEGETLFVAMDDPTNAEALAEVHAHAGMPVKVMVASPSEVHAAIRVYYFGESPSAQAAASTQRSKAGSSKGNADGGPSVQTGRTERKGRANPPKPPPDAAPAKARPQAASTSEQGAQGDRVEAGAASQSQGASGEASEPQSPGGGSPGMMTLTLLDGTQVQLPARGGTSAADRSAPKQQPSDSLTASELVSALMARAQGEDVSDLLPDDTRWETMFATLLTLLLRKGLIADWEFVDEWRKRQE